MVTCEGKSCSGRAEDAMHDSHKELSWPPSAIWSDLGPGFCLEKMKARKCGWSLSSFIKCEECRGWQEDCSRESCVLISFQRSHAKFPTSRRRPAHASSAFIGPTTLHLQRPCEVKETSDEGLPPEYWLKRRYDLEGECASVGKICPSICTQFWYFEGIDGRAELPTVMFWKLS